MDASTIIKTPQVRRRFGSDEMYLAQTADVNQGGRKGDSSFFSLRTTFAGLTAPHHGVTLQLWLGGSPSKNRNGF